MNVKLYVSPWARSGDVGISLAASNSMLWSMLSLFVHTTSVPTATVTGSPLLNLNPAISTATCSPAGASVAPAANVVPTSPLPDGAGLTTSVVAEGSAEPPPSSSDETAAPTANSDAASDTAPAAITIDRVWSTKTYSNRSPERFARMATPNPICSHRWLLSNRHEDQIDFRVALVRMERPAAAQYSSLSNRL